MKRLHKFTILCLVLMMGLCFGNTAFAAKTLNIGTASVSNTGIDDAARTVTLDVTLKGGANDVNGLVFTLIYDKNVFTFEGLVKNTMDIDDGSTYDSANPPSAATIASTLYYQTNNKATEGIVMIAAAAANFFTTTAAADFIPFKAKFKVIAGIGSGNYPIGIQKTIIGPDTAANAGYTKPTALAVAAGLDPTKEPTTAQTYDVGFVPGLITVTGGYDITGTAKYEGGAPADGATANLLKVLAAGDFKVASQIVKDGAYTFAKISNGTYKIEILSTKPGFQKRAVSAQFTIAGAKTVDPITLAAYLAKSGQVKINSSGSNLSGLRVEIRDGATLIGTAAVDATGNYVTQPLPVPLPGTYKLWAVYGSSEVELTSSDYDWILSLGTVSGTITGLCDGQIVEAFIRSATTKLTKSVLITGAGASNAFTLYNLLPGTDYILSVIGEGLGPVYFNGTEDFSSATPVAVTGGSDTPNQDFTFTCGDLVTIKGKATVDGTAVNGATVKANNFNFTNWKFGSAVTTADGSFEIKVAKSTDYYVYFTHEGVTYYYKDNTGTPSAVTVRSSATRVDVSAQSASGKNIPVLIPVADTAKLEGYVTLNRSNDNGGIPLENYLVGLFTTNNVPLPFVARTNGDGYYKFENMPPATYNVGLLPPPPYARQTVKGVVLANEATATVNFIVDQNYKVTGLVMDATLANTPVDSARVDIVKSDGQALRSATFTDALGSYTLVDIPSGVYTLIASHKDYFPKSQEETVLSDLTAATILLTKGAIISGTVSDANGPVVDAIVTLRGMDYVKSTKTKVGGLYEFRGLAPDSPHIIKVAKGTTYVPYTPDDVDTTGAGTTVTHNMTLVIPPTVWTFSGAVTEGGVPVAKAWVMLSSVTTSYVKVVQTNPAGVFTFTNVINGTDYSLLVLPGDAKPEIQEDNIAITADITNHNVTVPGLATISGTITLSVADATAIVIAGAYDPLTGALHQVGTLNSGDNKTFTYTITVRSGVAYKVFAQDLALVFPLRYWVSAGVSGSYSQAGDVTDTTPGIDITLTK